MGDGSKTQRNTPVDVCATGPMPPPPCTAQNSNILTGVAVISAGEEHNCVITTTGFIFCWGRNWEGQLGDGTKIQRDSPVAVALGPKLRPTATPTATPTSSGLLGDVNCNEAVDAIDAALVLQVSAGLVGSLACPENADVSRDGTVNSIDASLILQFVAGLLDSLPP